MQPKSDIVALKQIDRFLDEISEGLQMGFGSVFRVASQHLINWGVLVTDKNKRWIKEQAISSYLKEWTAGSEKSNDAIERSIARADLEEGNIRLNAHLGEVVVSILKCMHDGKRTFNIADIGAGAGDTIEAVLDALDFDPKPDTKRIAAYCNFYPIEPSLKRLMVAEEKWKEHTLYKLLPNPPMGAFGNHAYHFPKIQNGTFDILISNAVLHHIPFPDYLLTIREKLADDGVVVIGDWHTTIWKHPAFVIPVLEVLGADNEKVNAFKNFFEIKTGDRESLERELTPQQIEANRIMANWIKYLAEELKKVEERLFFLEGHEAFDDSVTNMEGVGFETNLTALKKKHRGFKELENNKQIVFTEHDLAGVRAVAKIPPPKRKKSKKGKPIRMKS